MSTAMDYRRSSSDRYIINHDIIRCTADGVVGNHLYSGRALGLSQPGDIIQLHPDLKPLWREIADHYDRIGLGHADRVIWDLGLDQWSENPDYIPSVFYFGPHEWRHWRDRDWLEAVEYINSKNNFMALAKELDVPVPDTQCFSRPGEIDIDALQDRIFPCYLKAAVSVAGVGIYRCADKAEFAAALARFAADTPVQVQEEVRADVFLNLQYLVTDDDLVRIAASEQILDGFAHQGNRVPARFEPWSVVEPMARWLKDRGIKGVFAFDVAVVENEEGVSFPAIECNPRFNGASYPTFIARKLGIPEWIATSFSTRHRHLGDIDIRDLEYDPVSGEGVIVVNWGTVLVGKLVILMAGTPEVQQRLAEKLSARL